MVGFDMGNPSGVDLGCGEGGETPNFFRLSRSFCLFAAQAYNKPLIAVKATKTLIQLSNFKGGGSGGEILDIEC